MLTPELGRVLVADDEIELMNALVEALKAHGYQATGVTSGQAALEALQTGDFDLLLTDLMMPGMDGIALLKASLAIDPHLVGVMMTGQGTVPTAVEAMKMGAFDYLLKPFRLAAMLPVLARAMEVRRLRLENIQLRDSVAIYNLSQVIAFSLDSQLIVEKTADAAAQQVEADEVSLMLVTPAGDELYVAAVRGEGREELLHRRVSFEEGIAGWVARQVEPLILNGEIRDARFAPVWPRPDIRSAISMPLFSAGKLVGVLNVNSLRHGRPFTWGQVKSLSILTSTAASALHSAALYEESERLRGYNLGIVETMAEGLTLEDAHGRISFANARLLTLAGYTADELIGQPWHTIVPRREHTRVAELSTHNAPGKASTYESALVAKDGREIPVLVSATQFVHGGQIAGILATFADLTERKQAEAAVQASEQRFRALIENGLDNISLLAADGSLLWESPAVFRTLGYAPDQFVGRNTFELIHPEDLDRTRNLLAELVREPGSRQRGSFRLRHSDGTWRWVEAVVTNLLSERSVAAIVVNYRDVTERKQAEEALTESEQRYRLLFESNPMPMWVYDVETLRFLAVNDAAVGHYGYSRAEFLEMTIRDIRPVEELTRLGSSLAQGPLGLEQSTGWKHRKKDGTVIEVEIISHEINLDGRRSRLVLANDITERVQAQTALWESEEKYRTLVETAEDVILLTDLAGKQLLRNKAYVSSLGLTAAEADGLDGFARVHPDDLAGMRTGLGTLLANGSGVAEYRIQHKDGRWIHRLARSSVIYDEAHQPKSILTIITDVTARKQAEAAVAASEAELRAMFAAMTDVVLVLDVDGRFLKIAPTNPSMLVKPPDELLGRTLHEVFPAAEADNLLGYIRLALQQTEPIHFEYSVTLNGLQTWFDGTASAMGPDKVFWIGRDISERIQRRHELEAIAAVSTSLRSAQTRAELAPVVLDQLLNLLSANGTALDLRDSLTGDAVVEAGRGAWAALGGQRMPAGQGIIGQVIATGRPSVTDDVTMDARLYPVALGDGIRAAACVPLIANGQTIGGLWVGRLAPLTAGDLGLMTTVADMAANAIHRASLFEQTEQRLQRLAALRAIDLAISSSLDLRVTLNVLLDQVIAQLHADAADVLLYNAHTRRLEYAAGRGLRSQGVENFSLRLGEGYAGRVALDRRTLTLPDLAAAEPDSARQSLLAGEGIRAYHGAPLIAKGAVQGVLEVFQRAPLVPDNDWLDFLQALAGQAAIAIDNTQLFNDLQRSNVDLSLAYEATIEGWSRALDLRDHETEGHSQRVTQLTVQLSSALGIGQEELVHIRRGALLHDIGKMGVPDSILLKPGPLTDDEWVIMRQHPLHAFNMLAPIRHLQKALDIPYCHHEKWDGTGYPRGLRGEAIPFAARIFAVVDVWDALSSDRPYRDAWPKDKVLEYIGAQSGTHFDPNVVTAFVNMDKAGLN